MDDRPPRAVAGTRDHAGGPTVTGPEVRIGQSDVVVRALQEHLVDGRPLSEECDGSGLGARRFRQWRWRPFENGTPVRDGGQAMQPRTGKPAIPIVRADTVSRIGMARQRPAIGPPCGIAADHLPGRDGTLDSDESRPGPGGIDD